MVSPLTILESLASEDSFVKLKNAFWEEGLSKCFVGISTNWLMGSAEHPAVNSFCWWSPSQWAKLCRAWHFQAARRLLYWVWPFLKRHSARMKMGHFEMAYWFAKPFSVRLNGLISELRGKCMLFSIYYCVLKVWVDNIWVSEVRLLLKDLLAFPALVKRDKIWFSSLYCKYFCRPHWQCDPQSVNKDIEGLTMSQGHPSTWRPSPHQRCLSDCLWKKPPRLLGVGLDNKVCVTLVITVSNLEAQSGLFTRVTEWWQTMSSCRWVNDVFACW